MHAPAKSSTAILITAAALASLPVQATFGPGDPLSGTPIFPTNRGNFCFGPNCVPGENPFGATQSPDCNFAGPGNPVPLFPNERRFDNFYSNYTAFNRYAWAYQPSEWLSLRGAYSRQSRAPDISELFGGTAGGDAGSTAPGGTQSPGSTSGTPPRSGAPRNLFDIFGLSPSDHLKFGTLDGDKLKIRGNYGWFYDRFKYELPKGGFDASLYDDFSIKKGEPSSVPNPNYYFKILPPADEFGGFNWPDAGSQYSDTGADRDPLFGYFGAGGRTSFNETDWDWVSRYSMFDNWRLPANRYSSLNFETPAGGLQQQFRPFVSQQTNINGIDWTSLTFDADYLGNMSNALNQFEIEFEINGCRVKAVPTDPNFVQTGRGSWGQAEDDQWAIKRVGFTDDEDSAWNQVPEDASPVIVAVIDTGLDWHHLDMSPDNIWRNEGEFPDNNVDDDGNGYVDDFIGWDFFGRNNKPWDFDGHGTIVAGIIAAKQDNGVGIAGINPHAKIMVLKAVNNFGNTRASYLAEAIVYAVDNGAQVINLSVGGPHRSRMEQAAIDFAHQEGVLVVAASGNEGIELDDYGPGGSDNVLTVGATFTDDRAAGFSNYGDKVDLVAPGVDVLSLRARYTDANYRPDNEDEYLLGTNYVGEDKRYIHVSGTSFAAPIVAATASLLMAKNPKMSAAEVRELLLQTAEDIETPGRDQYSGYGMVNAKAALGVEAGFFVTAQITGVDPVETETGTVLQINGTIDSDHFKRAWMQIGPGENPGTWKYVGQKRKYPIHDGVLGVVPVSEFAGADVWQIVINVEHKNGVSKSARYQVRLQ